MEPLKREGDSAGAEEGRLFAAEVGWDFAPALGLPFEDGRGVGVGVEPG